MAAFRPHALRNLLLVSCFLPSTTSFGAPSSHEDICRTANSPPFVIAEACTQWMEMNHFNRAQAAIAYRHRGTAYAILGQFHLALPDLTKAIEFDPDNATSYFNRGKLYADMNRPTDAIVDYTSAIQHNPSHANAYNSRGLAHAELGEFRKAIDDYDRALALRPRYGPAFANRARAYFKVGEYEKAARSYSRLIKGDAKEPMYFAGRAEVFSKIQAYKLAIEDYDRAIELVPDNVIYRLNRSNNHLALLNLEKAMMDLNYAIRIRPEISYLYIARGNLYKLVDDFRSAIADYSTAVDTASGDQVTIALEARGYAYALAGSYDLAIDDFDRAEAATDDRAPIRYKKGIAYYLRGDFKRALAEFSAAYEKEPGTASYALWHYFIEARNGDKAAIDSLKTFFEHRSAQSGWPTAMIDFLVRISSSDQLQEAIEDKNGADEIYKRCESELFFGLIYLANFAVNRARDSFARTIEVCPRSSFGHIAAKIELKRLQR